MPEKPLIDIKKYKETVTLMDDDFMSLCLNECIPCTQVIINIILGRKDVFGFGDMLYRIERYIEGRNERFNDGQHIIYVNCSAVDDGSDLWKLIHDMNCDDPNEMFIPEIAERTGYFINTEEGEITMNAYLAEVIKQQEEAVKRDVAQEIASKLLEDGIYTHEKIASLTELPLAEITTLANHS